MSDDRDTVVYEYREVPGKKLPGGMPAQDLSRALLDRFSPDQRRELAAFAAAGEFYHAANKASATRTLNQLKREDIAEAEQAAKAAEEGGDR